MHCNKHFLCYHKKIQRLSLTSRCCPSSCNSWWLWPNHSSIDTRHLKLFQSEKIQSANPRWDLCCVLALPQNKSKQETSSFESVSDAEKKVAKYLFMSVVFLSRRPLSWTSKIAIASIFKLFWTSKIGNGICLLPWWSRRDRCCFGFETRTVW